MKYLALDLGTKTGFGSMSPLLTGHWVLKKRKEHVGHATAKLRKLLSEMAPRCIGYEIIHFSTTTYSAHFYGALKAVVLEYGATHNIPVYGFTPQQIKKRATGNGRANKTAVRLHAEKVTGIKMTEDQADAFWCLVCLVEHVEKVRTTL